MLIRHNPLNLLNELNELSDLLEGNGKRSSLRDDASKVEGSRWAPAVDIKEEPSQFIFYVDVPGVDPKAIEISMENNILTFYRCTKCLPSHRACERLILSPLYFARDRRC